ncbi:MAG TPA: hypothetical protein VMT45_13860 [Thermoanaerobaculaceae bacterium]|nr:hypothetical protein [Thermoanaerobaculaceae bacterium]
MNALKVAVAAAAAVLGLAGTAHGATTRGFTLDVVLDGSVRPEYRARGGVYVEAVRGRPYVLRISNPLPFRVAVALSVDGLNTIDARHTNARSASKWVLGPYESVEIPGWQVSGSDARRFFFTGERSSYGAWLGKTDDLGVIEAVFYREKVRPVRVVDHPVCPRAQEPSPESRAGSAGAQGAPAPSARGLDAAEGGAQVKGELSDKYAATGIGERTRHDVESVHLDLEDRPVASVRIRYEFHDQLVRLGVLAPVEDPLVRREGARGFEGYCPDPFAHR